MHWREGVRHVPLATASGEMTTGNTLHVAWGLDQKLEGGIGSACVSWFPLCLARMARVRASYASNEHRNEGSYPSRAQYHLMEKGHLPPKLIRFGLQRSFQETMTKVETMDDFTMSTPVSIRKRRMESWGRVSAIFMATGQSGVSIGGRRKRNFANQERLPHRGCLKSQNPARGSDLTNCQATAIIRNTCTIQKFHRKTS